MKDLEIARNWTRNHYPDIATALRPVHERLINDWTLQFVDVDMFSAMICFAINNLPRNIFIPGMVVKQFAFVENRNSELEKGRLVGSISARHYALQFNSIYIDPTAGQICNLDQVRLLFPRCFVDRILVADIETITQELGFHYQEVWNF